MNNADVKKIYDQYVMGTYTRNPVCLVKGKGSRVWDLEGNEYLDFFPGWAVSGIGHCHPEVINAIKHQARKILHVPNNFMNVKQAELARSIIEISFPGKVFFCNSGAEANEGAIKYARKWGSAGSRSEIITMKQSFHGRTFGALSATGQGKVHEGFRPLVEGFRYAEFNNPESVKSQITDKTVAIMVEPILGEGGVRVAEGSFMKGLRQLCDEKNLLFIVDEVQSGMGRTGKYFGYQHYDVIPDIMTLAKALGGGAPIGAMVAHERTAEGGLKAGEHGSTYGGNPLVSAAALAVIRSIRKEKLLQNAITMGEYLEERFTALKEQFSCITEIRGLGLMRALALNIEGAPIVEAAMKKGLLINCTQGSILRIFPAMNVTRKLINQAMDILETVFKEAMVKV